MIPLVLLASEMVSSLHWPRERLWKAAKAYGPMFAALLAYALAYLRLSGSQTIPESDPYHITIGLQSFISGVEYYIGELLYIPNMGMRVVIVFAGILLLSLALRALMSWGRVFPSLAESILIDSCRNQLAVPGPSSY